LLVHRRRAVAPGAGASACDPLEEPSATGYPGDEDAAARQEVREAIAELTARQREIVMLVHWEGFTLVDAAHHLRIRPSTARTHYERARCLLRELLAL